MDDDNSKSLSKVEFAKAIQDFGLGFSKEHCVALFNYFDVDSSGQISYDEFLRAIRGPMNQARKKIVTQAFKKLDKDGNGWVDINDLRGVYNAKKHPDVVAGKKTEDDILKEFLATFEMHHSMRNNDAPNYVVTKEEFDEYYNNVSMSVDDDMYFLQMMNAAWRMDEKEKAQFEATKKRAAMDNDIFGTTERRTTTKPKEAGLAIDANQAQLIEHIRARIAARGARGIQGIGTKFRIADDDNSKALNKAEFKKAMHDFRIGLNDKQVGNAFDIFDRDGSGEISYDEFLRAIRGEMNAARVNIAKRAYNIMDSDKSGKVDINDIRQTYNAKQHPDVKSGKRTEDEVLMEFLDTFEDHFCDVKGQEDARDGVITMPEWLEYYNNVSMSIDNDEYFALMMNNTWNLDGAKVTKKGWGGEV